MSRVFTLWWTYKKLWKLTIEIVDFPIQNGGSFHGKMLVHQRVLNMAHLGRWFTEQWRFSSSIIWMIHHTFLVGGRPTPLKNMKVNGKDYPIYYGKWKNVWNHQPVIDCIPIGKFTSLSTLLNRDEDIIGPYNFWVTGSGTGHHRSWPVSWNALPTENEHGRCYQAGILAVLGVLGDFFMIWRCP